MIVWQRVEQATTIRHLIAVTMRTVQTARIAVTMREISQRTTQETVTKTTQETITRIPEMPQETVKIQKMRKIQRISHSEDK